MNSRIRTPLILYYVAARSLRSLRSNYKVLQLFTDHLKTAAVKRYLDPLYLLFARKQRNQ